MTLNFDLNHDLDLGFSRSNRINKRVDWHECYYLSGWSRASSDHRFQSKPVECRWLAQMSYNWIDIKTKAVSIVQYITSNHFAMNLKYHGLIFVFILLHRTLGCTR